MWKQTKLYTISLQTSHNKTQFDAFVENPIPTSIGLFTLAIIIIVLNSIAILVFLRRKTNAAPVDFPLLSLLVANLLQGSLTLPAYALKKISSFGDNEHAVICDVYRFSFFVSAHASILSLLASSVDRLVALLYPLRYWEIVSKKRIFVVVAFIWLFVICFDVVPFFTPSRYDKCHYTPVKAWSVSMGILMNIIPLPLLLVSYIVTIRIAYSHARRDVTFNSRNLSRRDKVRIVCGIRATRKAVMIIGSYFIFVGPACVYYLLEWLCHSCFTLDYKIHKEQYLHFFLKVLVNVHAVVSAVLFYWNSKDFRKKAREVLSGRERITSHLSSLNSPKKRTTNIEDFCDNDSDCSSLMALKKNKNTPFNASFDKSDS